MCLKFRSVNTFVACHRHHIGTVPCGCHYTNPRILSTSSRKEKESTQITIYVSHCSQQIAVSMSSCSDQPETKEEDTEAYSFPSVSNDRPSHDKRHRIGSITQQSLLPDPAQ